MQRHPQITRNRLNKFIDSLRTQLYEDARPLALEHYAAPDRIPFAQAAAGQYAPISLGQTIGPNWSTHWFRLHVSVPEAWRGQEVHLRWDSSCEACVWQDGQPMQGLSGTADYYHAPYHDAYTVSDSARGGESLTLYIEAAANHPFGVTEGHYVDRVGLLRMAEIAVFRRDIADLLWDMVTIAGMAEHLPSDSPRAGQALMTANAIVNAYLPGDDGSIRDCRDLARDFLMAQTGDGQHEITAIGHAHIDTAWLWPLAETHRKCIRTFSTVMRMMERYPDYKFVCSQAQQLAWVKEEQPGLYAQIVQRIKEGRFIPTGGAWVEPDCNLPSGESLVRQFVYGQKFYQSEYGWMPGIFWLPDTFGYPAALPQIMRGAGIEYFLTQKLSWNQFNKPNFSTFIWQGLDGSEVLTHFPPADTYNAIATVDEVLHSVKNFRDHGRSDSSLYVYGFGDGGGGPTVDMVERLMRLRDVDGMPRVQMASPESFFEGVKQDVDNLTTWVGELYFELHRGTYTTQAYNKYANRRSELLLRDVEFLSVLGGQYPSDALERLWKLVLLNQFHDILPGSSINEVYQDSSADYAAILSEGDDLRDDALANLLPPAGTGIALVNTLSFARTEVIELPFENTSPYRSAAGHPLMMVSAPSMGTAPAPSASFAGELVRLIETDGAFVLENSRLRAVLDAGGSLVSLLDKRRNRESITGPGSSYVLFEDKPIKWDAWDMDVYHLEKPLSRPAATAARVIEKGGLRAAVEFTIPLSDVSMLVQVVSLSADSPHLDFTCAAEWHEREKFLKVEFPLVVHTHNAVYETQYGIVERPTHFNTPYDVARFEVCAQRWGALREYGFGVALLNDSKYGYSARGNMLSLSLLRGPKWPDAEADQGAHRFRFALLPFAGDLAPVVQAGLAFNVPLLPVADASVPETSYFSLDRDTCVIDAVKQAEDGQDVVVRLYEAVGGRGRVTLTVAPALGITSAIQTDLLERPIEAPVAIDGNAVSFDIQPFQIITLRLGR
ncbi:MAG: alpha-mannosidase [Pleurocapsa minor GSE-CHR-MK-17-07R]|jgi:alpha-mannosidase|nr:alpha-mannosidase [Pleurocapsa minor GSE-CHR-MK 17-07R]